MQYSTYEIYEAVRVYKASGLALLLSQVQVPLVINNSVVMIAEVERTTVDDNDSWESGSTITNIVFQTANEQFFKIEIRTDSWDDVSDDIESWDITEVQPVTKTITAYRQVPYEKEVTEYR